MDRSFAFLLGDCARCGSRKGGKPQRHSVWSFLFASLRLCVTLSLNLFTASQRMYRKSVSVRKGHVLTQRRRGGVRVSQRDFHFSSACLSLRLRSSALKRDFRYILSDLPTSVAKMRKTREGTADERRSTQMNLQNLRASAFICGSRLLLSGFSLQIPKAREKLRLPHLTNNCGQTRETDMRDITHITSNA